MSNIVEHGRKDTKQTALASENKNKIFFPTDDDCIIMGGKAYGDQTEIRARVQAHEQKITNLKSEIGILANQTEEARQINKRVIELVTDWEEEIGSIFINDAYFTSGKYWNTVRLFNTERTVYKTIYTKGFDTIEEAINDSNRVVGSYGNYALIKHVESLIKETKTPIFNHPLTLEFAPSISSYLNANSLAKTNENVAQTNENVAQINENLAQTKVFGGTYIHKQLVNNTIVELVAPQTEDIQDFTVNDATYFPDLGKYYNTVRISKTDGSKVGLLSKGYDTEEEALSHDEGVIGKDGYFVLFKHRTSDRMGLFNIPPIFNHPLTLEFAPSISSYLNAINLAQTNYDNILHGKNLFVGGDSNSAGDFSGYVGETTFSDGIYAGEKKVYARFIALRNQMNLTLDAISGSVMGLTTEYVENPTEVDINKKYPFSYQRYLNIPVDTDYALLWFGGNDTAYVSLGSIDDETNETFYGAWNVVLQWIIENRPFLKLGIIVPYTSNVTYRQAVREVAQKWAIPFLDMAGDIQIPLMWQKEETLGVSSVAQSLRRQAFRVSDTNNHINPRGHEYQSTFIENFLRSL